VLSAVARHPNARQRISGDSASSECQTASFKHFRVIGRPDNVFSAPVRLQFSRHGPEFLCPVTGQVVPTNPAHSVRGPKHVVKKGKTPILTREETRALLDSIDVESMSGLRDRALIAAMVYSFARVGAVLAMKVEDYYPQGKRWWLRLHEKGGKRHEVPCHHILEEYLDAYCETARLWDQKKSPLFRTITNTAGRPLTQLPMRQADAWRMIRRRARGAGIETDVGCHTFRATGITAYLENGGTLEHAQQIAAHESRRTTKLYDRTNRPSQPRRDRADCNLEK
jgi:integrase